MICSNPVWPSGADPWIVRIGNTYYGMYTNKTEVIIQKADHPSKLAEAEELIVFRGTPGTPLACQFWAPELHCLDGQWYIYTTASDGEFSHHRVTVLESETGKPEGPYRFAAFLTGTDEWGIDATVITHAGKRYLVWARAANGEELVLSPMHSPTRIGAERIVIAKPQGGWDHAINEGAVQIPFRENAPLTLAFSANDCNSDDYCIATLELTGTDPMNPDHWKKAEKPFMTKGNGFFGPGHCGFFTGPDDRLWIVMHVITEQGGGAGKRAGWIQPLEMDGFVPRMGQHPVVKYEF